MTKQEILEATLELACEKGLGRISMQQIADKVNLKKSSLYSHFNSKDEIIENMYEYFRNKAKIQSGIAEVDYGKIVEGHSFYEILTGVVASYKKMNLNSDMSKFYRMIMTERTYNPLAAQIMVEETQKMITATKHLFYAISAKGIVKFENPDGAALLFAMGIHSLIDYEGDSMGAGLNASDGETEKFIEEFCRVYGNDSLKKESKR